MKNYFILLIGLVLLVSCSQHIITVSDSESNPEDVMRYLSFKKVRDFSQVTRTDTDPNVDEIGGDDLTVIICSWDGWGRTSKNCRGFGLCHFEWFPEAHKDQHIESADYFAAEVKSDSLGNKYMDIVLTEPIPLTDTDGLEMPCLAIDEDIFGECEELDPLINDTIIVEEGMYPFNYNLGLYGGYRLNIK